MVSSSDIRLKEEFLYSIKKRELARDSLRVVWKEGSFLPFPITSFPSPPLPSYLQPRKDGVVRGDFLYRLFLGNTGGSRDQKEGHF